MCEVDDQLEWFMTEGLEREDDVVDEEIAVCLANLVATRDVVKNGISGARRSGLKKKRIVKTRTILLEPVLTGAMLNITLNDTYKRNLQKSFRKYWIFVNFVAIEETENYRSISGNA